jgi:hypothetical protein
MDISHQEHIGRLDYVSNFILWRNALYDETQFHVEILTLYGNKL